MRMVVMDLSFCYTRKDLGQHGGGDGSPGYGIGTCCCCGGDGPAK